MSISLSKGNDKALLDVKEFICAPALPLEVTLDNKSQPAFFTDVRVENSLPIHVQFSNYRYFKGSHDASLYSKDMPDCPNCLIVMDENKIIVDRNEQFLKAFE